MKGPGAPKKTFQEKKLFPIYSYCRYEQNELIKRAAYKRGMSASTYVLSVVLRDAEDTLQENCK